MPDIPGTSGLLEPQDQTSLHNTPPVPSNEENENTAAASVAAASNAAPSTPTLTTRPLTNTAACRAYFDSRADTYELGPGSWHAELARDFVGWADISAGQRVLDLACGTGLVSVAAAAAAGPAGTVVAVDVSRPMLDVARRRSTSAAAGAAREGGGGGGDGSSRPTAPIEWIEADIADLSGCSGVHAVVSAHGGFDVITCCSALGYLPDRRAAVRHWAGFLSPGGRLVVDVPTDDVTVQYVSGTAFRRLTGIGVPFDRGWVTGLHSLEDLFTDAGLVVERSWRSRSYRPERWVDRQELEAMFEDQMLQNGVVGREAREKWTEIFNALMDGHRGQLKDAYAVYVTIGLKPALKKGG